MQWRILEVRDYLQGRTLQGVATWMVTRGSDSSKSPRILLVEDDKGVRDATRMLLDVEGFDTTAVATAQEALREARSSDGFDLIVSDYHLQHGQTGLEVIAALRAMLGMQLKAVLLTGDTSPEIKQLPQDPCLKIVIKPVKADTLLDLLWTLFEVEPARAPYHDSLAAALTGLAEVRATSPTEAAAQREGSRPSRGRW